MISAEADVNIIQTGGSTALLIAAEATRCSEDCLRLLIEAGADVNTTEDFGNTAVVRAIRAGHTKRLKVLIDAEADTNASQCSFNGCCRET